MAFVTSIKPEQTASNSQSVQVIWTDQPCKNFHLLICLAILDTEKTTLMENTFGLTEILKHINDMSMAIHLEETLMKAEGIYLQLKNAKHLPDNVKEILGFPTSSPSSSGSAPCSGKTTPVNADIRASPIPSRSNTPVSVPLTTVGYGKGVSARYQPVNASDNGQKSSNGLSGDESIEILPDSSFSSFSNYS